MRQQQSQVPGIITLPQHKHADSSSAASSPNLRHSSPSLSHSVLPDKPAPTVEGTAQKDQESKRRRRGKQNRNEGTAPLPDAESGPQPDILAVTPGKARRARRGGRANRQASPPLPEGDASTAFPSTTPPQSDYDAFSSLHSRSVPPDPNIKHHLHPRSHFPDAQSSGDEWEVPTLPVKPKENLSWQQELLRSGSGSGSARSKGNESPASRARSRGNGKDARTTGSLGSASSMSAATGSGGGKARPPLHTSVSENGTAAATGGANPSLNWQQELLLQTPDLTTLHQPSPVKPVALSALTPARQRRFQAKDNITFGLGELDLEDDLADDVFASPGRNGRPVPPHLQHQQGTPRQHRGGSHSNSAAATGFSTPTKAVAPALAPVSLEPRYAGPTFHNSPAPSSLPVPSFMRRRAEGVAA
ncbi:hypothetical protein JCM8547_009328 [Rhodosporidiobolus lusitaniae]